MDFSNLQFIGVIVIGIILISIIIAFIFSSKFRKDVIASEGEAAVLGLINVKGVIIVLLTAIFGGIFVYIIQLDTKHSINNGPELTMESAIDLLAASNNEIYKLENRKDSVYIKIAGKIIGVVPAVKNRFSLKLQKLGSNKWDVISSDKVKMGYFDLKPVYVYRNYYKDRNLNKQEERRHEVGIAFQEVNTFVNSDLVFRIDTVDVKGNSKYKVSFGEQMGEAESDIVWKSAQKTFHKSAGGALNNIQQFTCLTDPAWNKMYIVGLGVGNPGHHDGICDHVDLAQIVVVELPLSS